MKILLKSAVFVLVGWSLVVVAAATVEAASTPKPLHFGNMGGLLPVLKPQDLPEPDSAGAKLVYRMCGQCHNSPGPGMHTVKEWEQVFWRMYWRMHLMSSQFKDFQLLGYGEAEVVFNYLKKNAMRSVLVGDLDRNRPGVQEFVTTCSQCHPLPDPTQHQAGEWEGVVKRMKGHIQSMSRRPPNAEETENILEFLRGGSAQ